MDVLFHECQWMVLCLTYANRLDLQPRQKLLKSDSMLVMFVAKTSLPSSRCISGDKPSTTAVYPCSVCQKSARANASCINCEIVARTNAGQASSFNVTGELNWTDQDQTSSNVCLVTCHCLSLTSCTKLYRNIIESFSPFLRSLQNMMSQRVLVPFFFFLSG